MARRTLASWDFLGFAILNAYMHPVSADPSGLGAGDKGRMWFNTTSNKLMVWNGTTAIDFLARANHTGTQLASTISDFTTAVQAIPWGSGANPIAAINAGGQRVTNAADGIAGTDLATYGQLLALINNQVFKSPVRVATTANIASLAGGAPNTIDGVTLAANDRVLVKDQSSGGANGIYAVTTLGTGANGTWTRATDSDVSSELPSGAIVPVQEGTTNGDKLFMLITNGPITLGTTSLSFTPYGASSGEIGIGGAGLTKTGVTYDVGQGAGIAVAADSVAVDFTVVGKKYNGGIPATTSAPWSISGVNCTLNHAMANSAPIVNVVVGATPPSGMTAGQPVEVDWAVVDTNNLTITLPAAPATGNYIVTVIG